MSSADLQIHQLMQRAAEFFESRKIAYWVVGSLASMVYGEPRFTNDVDIVVDLTLDQIAPLRAAFPAPEYYLSELAARQAVIQRFQFNIIHPASGLKVDLVIAPDTEFARSAASRVRRISSEGEYSALFASPEDVLLNKLIYYQLSGGASDKHLRDIAGMMKILQEKLDRTYIAEWVVELGLTAEWEFVCRRVNEMPG